MQGILPIKWRSILLLTLTILIPRFCQLVRQVPESGFWVDGTIKSICSPEATTAIQRGHVA